MRRRTFTVSLLLLSLTGLKVQAKKNTRKKYDLDDPKTDHYKAALKFDEEGWKEEAMKSFQSAARFKPSTASFVNLGVALMRLGSATPQKGR